ncbi:MAG: hypothetical protein AAF705_20055 [Bacteroidota bacterium]
MITKKISVLILLTLLLSNCKKEAIFLPQEALYLDEIVEDFSVFKPCDTILAPNYQLTRAFNATPSISRLFYLEQPNSELVLLGRATEDINFQDNRAIYFHGLTIAEPSLDAPVFILSEDEVDIGVFGASNLYLVGQADNFETRFLLLTSTDALASSAFGTGDLFKVRLYDMEVQQGQLTVNHKLQLNATAPSGGAASFQYESLPAPDQQEMDAIQNAIANMRAGTFPFDPANQDKKFDLQLALYQRDFRFVEGLQRNTSFFELLSEDNQQTALALGRLLQNRSVSAFFCLSEQRNWSNTGSLAPNIPTALD